MRSLTILLSILSASPIHAEDDERAARREAYSAAICYNAILRRVDLHEIAQEKRYGRIGGVVSMRRLYSLQQHIRSIDQDTAAMRAHLKRDHVKPISCHVEPVATLARCFTGFFEMTDDRCYDTDAPERRTLAELVEPFTEDE